MLPVSLFDAQTTEISTDFIESLSVVQLRLLSYNLWNDPGDSISNVKRLGHTNCANFLREICRRGVAEFRDFRVLGTVLCVLQLYEEALQIFQSGIEIEKENPTGYVESGLVHHRMGEFLRASEYFSIALGLIERSNCETELDEQTTLRREDLEWNRWSLCDVLNSRASCYLSAFHHGESVRDYQKALEIREDVVTRSGLALAYAALGRADLAREEFEKGAKIDANHYRLRADRGYIKMLWKEYPSAVEDISASVDFALRYCDSTVASIHLWRRAFARLHCDALQDAVRDLIRSHELDPSFPLLEVGILRIPHLAGDFDDWLPMLGDIPATRALRKFLPTTDRMNERLEFLKSLLWADEIVSAILGMRIGFPKVQTLLFCFRWSCWG